MAVYYTIKCPHCDKILESGKNRSKKFGSPLCRCRFCGNVYVDKNYTEAGLLTDKQLKMRIFLERLWRIVASLTIITIGFVLALGLLFHDSFDTESLIIIIPMLFFGIIGIINFVSIFRSYRSETENIKKEIIESNKRLSNPYYVIALSKARISVPKYMLDQAQKLVNEENTKPHNKNIT